jgi:hypothetical protein
MTDEHASLAKAFCTVKCRETVGYARELLGGNAFSLTIMLAALSRMPKRSTPTKGRAR